MSGKDRPKGLQVSSASGDERLTWEKATGAARASHRTRISTTCQRIRPLAGEAQDEGRRSEETKQDQADEHRGNLHVEKQLVSYSRRRVMQIKSLLSVVNKISGKKSFKQCVVMMISC